MSNNQKGFSLVQTMVAVGLTGVLAFILMKNQESTSMAKSKRDSDDVVSQASTIIQKALSDRATCSLSLGGKETGADVPEIVKAQASAADYNAFVPVGGNVVKAGETMAGGVAVEKMTLVSEGGNDYLEVKFNLDPENRKKMLGSKNIKKHFQLQVARTGTTIASCYSETANLIQTSAIESCKSLNGVMANGKCEFMNELVDSTSTNCGEGASYKTEVVNGKIKLTCTPCTLTKKFTRYNCEKKVSGMNWINVCYYKSGCQENPTIAYGYEFWEVGPTHASGGDTGTKNNCYDRRKSCPGE